MGTLGSSEILDKYVPRVLYWKRDKFHEAKLSEIFHSNMNGIYPAMPMLF